MPKTSTRGRIVGLAAAVVIGAAAAVVFVMWSSGGGTEASADYTPVNRHLSLVARDVLHAVADWREAVQPADGEEGAGGAENAAVPAGPAQLTIELRERGVDELPDDLAIVVCPDLRAWCDVNAAKGYKPLVAARSASALGGNVILYDGQAITTIPTAQAPAWVATGVAWTKADVAGSEKSLTLTK